MSPLKAPCSHSCTFLSYWLRKWWCLAPASPWDWAGPCQQQGGGLGDGDMLRGTAQGMQGAGMKAWESSGKALPQGFAWRKQGIWWESGVYNTNSEGHMQWWEPGDVLVPSKAMSVLSALKLCKQTEVSLEAAQFQLLLTQSAPGRCWFSVRDFLPPGLWTRLWTCKGPEDDSWYLIMWMGLDGP